MFPLSIVLLSLMSAALPSSEPPVPERWHAWPVARVFPSSVPGTSPSGARVTYVLAGVAPESPCRVAFQPGVARLLRGCVTALRATYADSTQTFVATVGIAVLTGPGALRPLDRLTDDLPLTLVDRLPNESLSPETGTGHLPDTATGRPGAGPETGTGRLAALESATGRGDVLGDRSENVAERLPTVRPVAFPDGPAERFGESQYVTGVLISSNDAYVVATAAGYADGRPYQPGELVARRLGDTARRLATALYGSLTR